jgi:D-serine deaminase-like pyridoxal phosphate-dependent protein
MTDQTQRPWYEIDNIENIDSPCLVVYADRVRKNIEAAIGLVGDVQRLRPHVKTHKSPDVTRLMLHAGITKFKCATIAEAEMLGACGAPDVLLAYQPVGPKVQRLLQLVSHYQATRFSCLVDTEQAAQHLDQQAREASVTLDLFLDLNVGMNRTGIAPDDRALTLCKQIAALENLKLQGLHAYDGHITHPDLHLRTRQCDEAFAAVEQIQEKLAVAGQYELVLVIGGSPTYPIHAKRKGVECSPGTFVFWDAGYSEAYPEQPFQPAALAISRIISIGNNGHLCTDLGHKSVAAENPLSRRVRFINASDFTFVGQSEEHLVVENKGGQSFAVGDVLYGMPLHICPTCALYESALVVEDHIETGEWKIIARNRKINY